MKLNQKPLAAPACLPPQGEHPPPGTKCWVAGWGQTESGSVAEQLQEVDLDIMSDQQCANTMNGQYLVKDAMFCAGKSVYPRATKRGRGMKIKIHSPF